MNLSLELLRSGPCRDLAAATDMAGTRQCAATDMAGAARTRPCQARPKAAHPERKAKRARDKWAGLESNQPPLPYQRSALPHELPARAAPGQGLEPQSPRSERGVLPLDDPGSARWRARVWHIPHLRPSPYSRRSTQQRDLGPQARTAGRLCHVQSEAERCFPSHSPTLRPWIDDVPLRMKVDRRPTWRSFGARASRAVLKNRKLKHTLNFLRYFSAKRRGSFSLRRGLDSI